MEKEVLIYEKDIHKKIHIIRGVQVMLDSDLAQLYSVKVKRLNEQVKRNLERFPERFMFQITQQEGESLRSQIATSNTQKGGRRYLPHVFTEQGVAMLSTVLRSKESIKTSIQIIDAFVAMRKFINRNINILNRLEQVEQKQLINDIKFEKIFNALTKKEIEQKNGVFYDGQIFDSHVFVSRLIKSAKRSIILLDNYIDESVLILLTKRIKNVTVKIYTRNIDNKLKLDIDRHNKQYPKIEVQEFNKCHDRFLIIDEQNVYHIGASLKDLGKKWFGFSKLDSKSLDLLKHL